MNPEQLQNTSNLTPEELNSFLKLPKDQQEKEKDDRLVHLKALNDQLDLAIQEGLKTGKPEEAQRLLEELRQGVQDLGQEIEATEEPPEPELVWPELPFEYKKIILKTDPTITSPEEAEKAIISKGMLVGKTAKEILQKTFFTSEQKEYQLVSFSVEDLGFPDGGTVKEVYQKADDLGLGLCPVEVGSLLRLQYTDQPNSECLIIAMVPVYLNGILAVNRLYRIDDGIQWLGTRSGNPGSDWPSNFRLVFMSHKD